MRHYLPSTWRSDPKFVRVQQKISSSQIHVFPSIMQPPPTHTQMVLRKSHDRPQTELCFWGYTDTHCYLSAIESPWVVVIYEIISKFDK